MRLSPMFQSGDMIYHGVCRYVLTIYTVISTLQCHDMHMHMPQVINQITEFDCILLIASLILICFSHENPVFLKIPFSLCRGVVAATTTTTENGIYMIQHFYEKVKFIFSHKSLCRLHPPS